MVEIKNTSWSTQIEGELVANPGANSVKDIRDLLKTEETNVISEGYVTKKTAEFLGIREDCLFDVPGDETGQLKYFKVCEYNEENLSIENDKVQ